VSQFHLLTARFKALRNCGGVAAAHMVIEMLVQPCWIGLLSWSVPMQSRGLFRGPATKQPPAHSAYALVGLVPTCWASTPFSRQLKRSSFTAYALADDDDPNSAPLSSPTTTQPPPEGRMFKPAIPRTSRLIDKRDSLDDVVPSPGSGDRGNERQPSPSGRRAAVRGRGSAGRGRGRGRGREGTGVKRSGAEGGVDAQAAGRDSDMASPARVTAAPRRPGRVAGRTLVKPTPEQLRALGYDDVDDFEDDDDTVYEPLQLDEEDPLCVSLPWWYQTFMLVVDPVIGHVPCPYAAVDGAWAACADWVA
jgi:hypothetical protein